MAKVDTNFRVGRQIRAREVRVVDAKGEQLGVMTIQRANLIAEGKGLDLVEVSPKARPPVCRVMDYGKFKYEQAKKERAAKTSSSATQVKEVSFRPKTGKHDMDFKVRHVKRFLEEGHKVKLTVIFRGREITHPEVARALLRRVCAQVTNLAKVEQVPGMETRRMSMMIAPKGIRPGTSSAGAGRGGPTIETKRPRGPHSAPSRVASARPAASAAGKPTGSAPARPTASAASKPTPPRAGSSKS